MKDTKELSPVQVLREATIADLASEIGTARSVGGSAYEMLNCLACLKSFCARDPILSGS